MTPVTLSLLIAGIACLISSLIFKITGNINNFKECIGMGLCFLALFLMYWILDNGENIILKIKSLKNNSDQPLTDADFEKLLEMTADDPAKKSL